MHVYDSLAVKILNGFIECKAPVKEMYYTKPYEIISSIAI